MKDSCCDERCSSYSMEDLALWVRDQVGLMRARSVAKRLLIPHIYSEALCNDPAEWKYTSVLGFLRGGKKHKIT